MLKYYNNINDVIFDYHKDLICINEYLGIIVQIKIRKYFDHFAVDKNTYKKYIKNVLV